MGCVEPDVHIFVLEEGSKDLFASGKFAQECDGKEIVLVRKVENRKKGLGVSQIIKRAESREFDGSRARFGEPLEQG
ncbi:MAG: hypothetical protein ACRD2L_13660, partial [Terriglobia bacterium]